MELTRNVSLRRLQWVGHVMRMKDEKMPKKALKGYKEGKRSVGRHRGRWLNAADRDAWKWWIEEAKSQVGLQQHKKEEGEEGGGEGGGGEDDDDDDALLNAQKPGYSNRKCYKRPRSLC